MIDVPKIVRTEAQPAAVIHVIVAKDKIREVVFAASWPSPFGLLLPGAMGFLAADGWCFGELALAFALTRPTYEGKITPPDGSIPPLVWVLLAFYAAGGVLIPAREFAYWRKRPLRWREP